jgi:hypothetical protein
MKSLTGDTELTMRSKNEKAYQTVQPIIVITSVLFFVTPTH